MDRLSHLRGEAGGSRDSTLDTTSPPSESFMTANESTSKYYSLSEVDSTFDISSIKDVSLASTTTDSEETMTNADELISNLSPIRKKNDILDSYKIGKQIEAANILSGGVDIFDDNDNSYDGDELVIDDNVDVDEKCNSELKQADTMQFKSDENIIESSMINEEDDIASKDTEVVLQIDGKNVDAIDIGNGLYLYRKEGQEELAAVQIIDDDQQQPSFKFLKVRENAEGNLEVYEEIEIEVPKEVPAKEGKTADKKISSHVPIKDINKVISDTASNKVAERKVRTPKKEPISTTSEVVSEVNKETSPEGKSEVNFNGKMMKLSESRKSPVIGSFKPMTYHSTPNKEGKPLTKTMVDQQLHPNRHSDNIKKTIEVHTDSCKQRPIDTSPKYKDDDNKTNEITSTEKDIDETNEKDISINEIKEKHVDTNESNENNIDVEETNEKQAAKVIPQLILDDDSDSFKVMQSSNKSLDAKSDPKNKDVPMEQDNAIDSTEKDLNKDKVILQEDLQIQEKTKSDVNVIDEKHVESVKKDLENIEADSNEEQVITKPLVQSNTEILAKEGDIIEINNDEPLAMEIDGPELGGLDPSDKENKAMEDNTHGDKQTATKADTNIKDETQCNVVEEIIVIDDGVDESTIEENIFMEKESKVEENIFMEKESKVEENMSKVKEANVEENMSKVKESKVEENMSKEKESIIEEHVSASDTKAAPIDVNDQEEEKVEANIVIKTTATQFKDSVQNAKEKDVAVVKKGVTTTDTKVALEPPKEKMDETPPVAESGKNNPSKIPIKLTNKPSKIESEVKVEPTKSEHLIVDTSKEKVPTPEEKALTTKEITPTKNSEVVLKKVMVEKDKNTPLDIKPAKPDENTGDSKTVPIDVIKSKDKPEVVSQKLDMIVTQGSDVTTTVKMSQQNEIKPIELKTTPKKEPKHSIQEESDASVVPMEVDSTVEVKMQVYKDEVISELVVTNVAEMEKPIVLDQASTAIEIPESNAQNDEEKKINILPKDSETQVKNGDDTEVSKEPKEEPMPSVSFKQDVCSTSSTDNKGAQEETSKVDSNDKEGPSCSEPKPANNNNAAVPFGKWTATNRKEFLDKIKNRAPAAPTPSTSSNQLKNSNDLNRRDVLKKIDSQRQSSNALSKTQEANKNNMKNETAFLSKTNLINKDNNTEESKIPLKVETVVEEQIVEVNTTTTPTTTTVKHEDVTEIPNEPSQAAVAPNVTKKESSKRTEVNYQDLIDKTIEGMIHRTVPSQKVPQDELNHNSTKEEIVADAVKYPQNYEPTDQATLDAIEMKMNELHGIPFIERPPHELPQVPLTEPKTYSKSEKDKLPAPTKAPKLPNLLPFTNKSQQKILKESIIEVDSEDEIIEHEPITGDIDLNKKSVANKPTIKEKIVNSVTEKSSVDTTKKEVIITENDFDKFARRNSITYENRLTVNFDGKEPHNVIQTVVEKDPYPKNYSRNDIGRGDHKSKLPYKYQNVRQNPLPAKVQHSNKFGPATEDSSNRNHSKLQKAYQSALTAKRQMECPITIIEDKPVKVVFMDNMEFVPSQLNVQGQELSPSKKRIIESDNITVSTYDSLEDTLDTEDSRSQDEVKIKTKHQRKQVFTPVDEPELELIEPKDLGPEVSPKKKRKSDEDKTVKYPIRKKYYLLGSNTVTDEKVINPVDIVKNPLKETVNRNDNGVGHKNAVSAIDNLVKAAELIEHQSENFNISEPSNPDSQQSTPVKRGRGRPRKYPLPDGTNDKNKAPSPQKKPRLIDAKAPQRDTTTDDDSDDEIIKENWTMGKINENIVCPICSKLFRTENVVFKHVKHCTGPSPSRSDSDKRSPRRMRQSQESDSKSRESQSDDMDIDDDEPLIVRKETPKKHNSKDSIAKSDDKDDVIVIEDTPVKEKPEIKENVVDERKHHESRKPKPKAVPKNNDLVCEFCGKTFRQLSYLVSHKLQHKKDELKKTEKDPPINNKSVYSCEVCKKQFRKLHHLVQHRIIHNPSSVPARSLRKSSSEQSETKVEKEPRTSKQSNDPSAGFRCEPCDKSFRKLHHLVEHRETHDGINRQKTTAVVPNNVEKPRAEPIHQCDVCKKIFNKAQLLIEHKEQHVETSSEKSDDKSVKSSLSTRDIIHECSHCYKVFPNEHSLNKHSSICQRKKRQSKQDKPADKSEDVESVTEVNVSTKTDEKLDDLNSAKPVVVQTKDNIDKQAVIEKIDVPKEKPEAAKEMPPSVIHEMENVKEIISQKVETEPIKPVTPAKRDFTETQNTKTEVKSEVPEKIKKIEIKETPKIIQETPKKKIAPKEKSTPSSSKRLKTTTAAVSVADEVKTSVESSDEDEIRYMLNPNFQVEETTEEKVFMKVKAKKRSSLQIERPNSKDLVRRRTSLQHPPKIPRLKPKAIEVNSVTVKNIIKAPKFEPVPSTDSDDSETVKYSFPKTIPEKTTKPAQDRTPKDVERKTQKKSLVDKRKSLSGIAKRKSLGKAVVARHKPSPMKQIKRRTVEVEHRCDCGQLFSSAALLSRHTTLAHTPPRIRRRRSPPPEDKPVIKPAPRKSSGAEKPKQTPALRKSSARSDSSTSGSNTKPIKSQTKPTRKTLDADMKTPADSKKPKPDKSEATSSVKPRRTGAHRGVPVPEKMRKLMQKNNK